MKKEHTEQKHYTGTPSRLLADKVRDCADDDALQATLEEFQPKVVRKWEDDIKFYKKRWRTANAGFGFNNEFIAKRCGVDERTIKRDLKEPPFDRQRLLAMLALFRLTPEEVNKLLGNHTIFKPLYSRDPDDFIWCYIFARGGSEHPLEEYSEYKRILKKLCARETGGTYRPINTHMMTEYVLQQREAEDFEEVVKPIIASFCTENKVLQCIYTYVAPSRERRRRRAVHVINEQQLVRHADMQLESREAVFGKYPSFLNRYIGEEEKMQGDAAYYPERPFLIAFAVHMEMDEEDINEFLAMAGMTALCRSRDKTENTLECVVQSFVNHIDNNACSENDMKSNESWADQMAALLCNSAALNAADIDKAQLNKFIRWLKRK